MSIEFWFKKYEVLMKPLDCKGEINKCKIDIVDNRKNEILRELLTRFGAQKHLIYDPPAPYERQDLGNLMNR